jgi:hypothetical protein
MLFSVITLVSCKKEMGSALEPSQNKILQEAKEYLKSKMRDEDFALINWGKSILPQNISKVNVLYLKQLNASNDEYIIAVQNNGRWSANYLTLQEMPGNEIGAPSGLISVVSLDKSKNATYRFSNGKIISDQILGSTKKETSAIGKKLDSDEDTLPEVSVRGIRFGGRLIWLSLYWMIMQEPGYRDLYVNEPQRYNPELPEGGGGGTTEVIEPEEDKPWINDSINITKIINCFGNVPNTNATYTVKIHSDIPVNSNPDAAVSLGNGSSLGNVGHVFLRLTKTSGAESVSQVIGFYPRNGMSAITSPMGYVDGVLVNDGRIGNEHEYNASFALNVSATDFQKVINRVVSNANQQYSLQNFNCAHFALDAFREIYPSLYSQNFNPLGYPLGFGTMFTNVDESPQGLYKSLASMYLNGVSGVEFNVYKKAMPGKGECN